MSYKQLTQEERYHIYALLKAKYNQQDIANALERSASSKYREIQRNERIEKLSP